MGSLRANIDLAEEVLLHEVRIRLRAVGGKSHVFVEIERRDVAEIELVIAMKIDEFAIKLEWRAASGKSEHGRWLFVDDAGHESSRHFAGFFR